MKKAIFSITLALNIVACIVFNTNLVAAAEIYKGIDVYEYSNISSYAKLKNEGIQVVIQKATEGITHNDALLYYRANMLKQYGFSEGYYHYADNDGQPVAQAQHFLSRVNGLHSDTVLWLDIENEDQWSKNEAISFTNQFINYVQKQGYKIGIYTGLSFYYEYLYGNIPAVPMWLASYGAKPKEFPFSVSWQYTGTGYLAGVEGNVDLDQFNSSIFTGETSATENNKVTMENYNYSTYILQSNLSKLLQYKVDKDGVAGPQTIAATKQFQNMVNLKVDGICGKQTSAAMGAVLSEPDLKYKANGTAVRYIQYRLGIRSDGIFGNETRQAVLNFQKVNGLKVDGVIGKMTWSKILK